MSIRLAGALALLGAALPPADAHAGRKIRLMYVAAFAHLSRVGTLWAPRTEAHRRAAATGSRCRSA